jgi:hypothetical protein
MVAEVHDVSLPCWLAAYRLLRAPGGSGLTPRQLQEELSLPSRKLAGRILSQVRKAMADDVRRQFPSRPVKQPAAPTAACMESWQLADAFWDHNG